MSTARSKTSTASLSAQERAKVKERAAELKTEARNSRSAKKRETEEAAVLAAISTMQASDRALAEKLHAVVLSAAPDLSAKLWYGQPAWAKDGKVVCFFRSGGVDAERYSTFGFSAAANLDDGGLWPTSYAVTKLTAADAKRLAALVKQAVS